MSFTSEFREFAVKGSVIDLAVGIIIGAAFGKIVDSLVKDIIMPVVGAIFGGLDFSNWFIMLKSPPAGYSGPMTYDALTKAGVPLFAYGSFITAVINFLILALIIFIIADQSAEAADAAGGGRAPRTTGRGRTAARNPRRRAALASLVTQIPSGAGPAPDRHHPIAQPGKGRGRSGGRLKRLPATPIIDRYSSGALQLRRFVDSQGFR